MQNKQSPRFKRVFELHEVCIKMNLKEYCNKQHEIRKDQRMKIPYWSSSTWVRIIYGKWDYSLLNDVNGETA